MTIKQVSEKQVEKNTAELENRFLTSNIDTSFVERFGKTRHSDQIIDIALATLARYGNKVTIDEILEAEELEDYEGDRYECLMVHALTVLYSLWVDKHAIMNREDNLLGSQPVVPGEESWKKDFRQAVLNLVLEKGQVIGFYASHYGWEDWEFEKGPVPAVVAAFNLKEDWWQEFEGTFTENKSKTGFVVTVMYEDGIFRHIRFEGELGEIIRGLTGM